MKEIQIGYADAVLAEAGYVNFPSQKISNKTVTKEELIVYLTDPKYRKTPEKQFKFF